MQDILQELIATDRWVSETSYPVANIFPHRSICLIPLHIAKHSPPQAGSDPQLVWLSTVMEINSGATLYQPFS